MENPTDEQIIEAVKSKGQEKGVAAFCDLVRSTKSRGCNTAFDIGFIEGAVWCRNFINKIQIKNE